MFGYPCVVGKVLEDTSKVNPKKLYVPFIFPERGDMIVATDALKFDVISISLKETFYSVGAKGRPAEWLHSTVDDSITADVFTAYYYSDEWTFSAITVGPVEEEDAMRRVEGS